MKFHFQKLGAIDEANIELSPLTIICGRNNTGKTYVSYAIFALLTMWRQFIHWEVPAGSMSKLVDDGTVSLDMKQCFVDQWSKIKEKTNQRWKEFLPQALGAKADRLQSCVVSFEIEFDDRWQAAHYKQEFRSDKGKLLFSAEKEPNTTSVEFVAVKDGDPEEFPRFALEQYFKQALLEAVLGPYFPQVFMVSTERTGAVAFKEELNLTKNKIVNLLATLESGKDFHPGQLFEAIYKRGYPLPVESNVTFVNRFSSLEQRSGELISEFPELVREFELIAGGKYETSKDGVSYFTPQGSTAKLQLSEASSAVRSLAVFWYWLRAEANKGTLLLIDEPELNLHPENQRAFARLLVTLVNKGIQVLMTTHSDTMIREFNTLIMLSQDLPHILEVAHGNGYSPDEKLNPKLVKLYVATGKDKTRSGRNKKNALSTLKEFQPSIKLGFEADIFDECILQMNRIQDSIRFGAAL